MKFRSNVLILFFLLSIVFSLSSCKKLFNRGDNDSGGNGNPIQENSTVKQALSSAGITTYDGNTPPTLEGTYSTTPMQCYAAEGVNLQSFLYQYMNSVFKLYGQTTAGDISFSEKLPSGLFGAGKGCYITGSGNNFTIWMENSMSNGNKTAFVLSGTLETSTGNLINCKSITVFTYTAYGSDYSVGDWYAARGWIQKLSGIMGNWLHVCPYDSGTHRGPFYHHFIFNADGTCSHRVGSDYSDYWTGTYTATSSHVTYSLHSTITTYVDNGSFDYVINGDQMTVTNCPGYDESAWNRE